VEAGDVDRHKGAANLLDVAVPERRDPAGMAKAVMTLLAAELVDADTIAAREQAEVLWLDGRIPGAQLAAVRAIAAAGAGLEGDIGLVPHPAAVTASVIGLFHPSSSSGDRTMAKDCRKLRRHDQGRT